MSALPNDYIEEIASLGSPEDHAEMETLDLEQRMLDHRWTDGGNAARFLDMHEDKVIRVAGIGWFHWNGVRWKRDETDELQELAGETIRMLYSLSGSKQVESSEERQKILKFATASDRLKPRHDMVAIASSSPRVVRYARELDADDYALNCQNGIVNLRDGSIRPHEQTALCTMLAPVEYHPETDWGEAAPTWARFLKDVFLGDQSLIDYTQRAMGYALTGDPSEEIMLMLWGEGENGKSKFLEVMLAIFGDYSTAADPSLLMAKRNEGGPSPELLKLRGKRLISAVETAEDRRLDATMVKRLTGRDTVTARAMRSDVMVEFSLQALLVVATNHKPRLPETGRAMRRRLRLLPWLASFTKEAGTRDPEIGAKLWAERSGILAWLIQGCIAWQRDGLPDVDTINRATDLYMEEEDPIGAFITDVCEIGPTLSARSSDLYKAYLEYASAQGETHPMTQTKFGRKLTSKGFEDKPGKTARRRLGIGLQNSLEVSMEDAG